MELGLYEEWRQQHTKVPMVVKGAERQCQGARVKDLRLMQMLGTRAGMH